MISAVSLQQFLGSCSTDACRQSSIHFSSIFHLLSSSLKTSSSSPVLRNGARDVPLVIFCNLDFPGGAASVFLARQQEDPHYKERRTLALFFLSGNGQQLRLLVQRGVLSLL
jgi:hypothetical protein